MHDAELMQVGNSTDDMLEKSAGLNLLEFCLLDDVVKKFSFFLLT